MASDLDFLEDFGVDPNSVQTKAKFGNITSDIIFEWLTELTGENGHLQTALKERDVVSAGGQNSDLAGSISFDITDPATQLKWTVSMNDYWYWVEYGRKPTAKKGSGLLRPKIVAWIEKKGINPVEWMKRISSTPRIVSGGKVVKGREWKMPVKSKYTLSEREYALKSLSYIISGAIHRNGTTWQQQKFGEPGTRFISRTLEAEVPKLQNRLEIALGRRLQISVKSALKNLKTKK